MGHLFQLSQNIRFAEKEQLLLVVAIQLDLGAAEFGQQNAVTFLHANWNMTASGL